MKDAAQLREALVLHLEHYVRPRRAVVVEIIVVAHQFLRAADVGAEYRVGLHNSRAGTGRTTGYGTCVEDDPASGRERASVRARGRDRSRVTDRLRRQILAASASRGERPRAVVILAKNHTGRAGQARGEDAPSRDEVSPRGVRGSRTTVGRSAASRPRQSEHTTHLSRFRERARRGKGEGGGRASEVCRVSLPPAAEIVARASSPWRIHTRNHERAVVSSVRTLDGEERHRAAHQDAHARDRCRRSTSCMASGVAVFEVRTRTARERETRPAAAAAAARPTARAASPSVRGRIARFAGTSGGRDARSLISADSLGRDSVAEEPTEHESERERFTLHETRDETDASRSQGEAIATASSPPPALVSPPSALRAQPPLRAPSRCRAIARSFARSPARFSFVHSTTISFRPF